MDNQHFPEKFRPATAAGFGRDFITISPINNLFLRKQICFFESMRLNAGIPRSNNGPIFLSVCFLDGPRRGENATLAKGLSNRPVWR
jgi:hypothetical protein